MVVVEWDVFDRILQSKGMAFAVQVEDKGEYPTEDSQPEDLRLLIKEFYQIFESPQGLTFRRTYDHQIPLINPQ